VEGGLQLLGVKRGMNELLDHILFATAELLLGRGPSPTLFLLWCRRILGAGLCCVQSAWGWWNPGSGCRCAGDRRGKLWLDVRKNFSVVRLVKYEVAQRGCVTSIPAGVQDSAGCFGQGLG